MSNLQKSAKFSVILRGYARDGVKFAETGGICTDIHGYTDFLFHHGGRCDDARAAVVFHKGSLVALCAAPRAYQERNRRLFRACRNHIHIHDDAHRLRMERLLSGDDDVRRHGALFGDSLHLAAQPDGPVPFGKRQVLAEHNDCGDMVSRPRLLL